MFPFFQLIRDYIHSLEAIRCGYEPYDKFTILVNRILHASYSLNYVWYRSSGRTILAPRTLIRAYRCKYGDFIFHCPGGNSEIQFLERHEPAVKQIVAQVHDGDAVDVGANLGLYTMILSKRLAERGKVLSIEPDPFYFRQLRKNVDINKCRNVFPVNMAAWSANEKLKLTRHAFGGAPTDTYLSQTTNSSSFTVRGAPLDELLSRLSIKPRLVKIDVEGAEYQVLSGMENTLQSNRPTLIFEAQTEQTLAKCTHLLRDARYSVRALDDGNFLGLPN